MPMEWTGIYKVKILQVHNFYATSAPSGENSAVETDRFLLEQSGHDVSTVFVYNDDLSHASRWRLTKASVAAMWSRSAAHRVSAAVESFRPDVVHVHNTFPQLSASIFGANGRSAAAWVATIHNYRFFCAKGIPLRGGRQCTDCWRNSFPAIVHRCYRDSLVATIPAALFVESGRRWGAVAGRVDKIIGLSSFQNSILAQFGVPGDKLELRSNPIRVYESPVPADRRERRAIFIGRISTEKGLEQLMFAMRDMGAAAPPLDVLGDGPDRSACVSLARQLGLNDVVTFQGQRSAAETQQLLARSRVLIAPFRSWEGLPTVLLEAAALGVPVICPSFGASASVVDDRVTGLHFEMESVGDFVRAIHEVFNDDLLVEAMSERAREKFSSTYSQEASMARLMQIYERAIVASKTRLKLAR